MPLKSGESLIDTDEEMSEALNRYFLTVLTKERLDDIPQGEQIYKGEAVEGLTGINLSRGIMIRQIDRLKTDKSSGPDEISPRVLKECKSEISGQQTEAFLRSR